MEKKVKFEYDPAQNILFTEDHWEIRTKEDVDEFFARYEEYVAKLSRKVYLVANIDNLTVHADILDYYGETARKTIDVSVLGFARWGKRALSRMSIRTTSMKAKIDANIYNTREEAIQAIEKMKEGQLKED